MSVELVLKIASAINCILIVVLCFIAYKIYKMTKELKN